jgi:serine/threonine protein kinase
LNQFIEEYGGKPEYMKLYLRIFLQVISAVSAVHDMNQVHRDIKAENVFLKFTTKDYDINQVIAKLGDFGISRNLSKNTALLKTVLGTYHAMAPER